MRIWYYKANIQLLEKDFEEKLNFLSIIIIYYYFLIFISIKHKSFVLQINRFYY